MTQSRTNTRGNDDPALALLLVAIAVPVALSATLGNCPTSSYNARILEGTVIFAQLMMLGGGVLLGGLFATRNVRRQSAGKWWLFGGVLLVVGIVASGQLLAQYGGMAACTDGLFGWLP